MAGESKPPEPGASVSPESTTLYFGNLHQHVAVAALQDLCSYFGQVDQVKVIKEKATGTSAGYGFVKFAQRSVAEAALHTLNGKVFLGQELRVNWAFQSHQKEDTSHHFHIFVGDLGQDVTDAMLYNSFCIAGSCSEARVMWDHTTGRSKGYGFVSFRTKEDADAAITKMHGQNIGSRRVRCGWAQHKQDDSQRPPDVTSVNRADPLNTNVYVGNVSQDWTEADLTQHFQEFGNLLEVRLHKKGGYGFVRFESHNDAVAAIVKMHGATIGDRTIKCSWGKNTAPAAAAAAAAAAGHGAYSHIAAAAGMSPYLGGMQPMAAVLGNGGAGLMPAGLVNLNGTTMMLNSHGQLGNQQQVIPMSMASQVMMLQHFNQPTSLASQMQQQQQQQVPQHMGVGVGRGLGLGGPNHGLQADQHPVFFNGGLYYGAH